MKQSQISHYFYFVNPVMRVILNRQKLYHEMNQSLNRKYEYLFHFYQVKWINDLLDASHHNQTYQQFVDMRVDVEDVEFLKRIYYYKTPTGKLEIENRLKLCTQFYSTNLGIMYEYPMMIVTNTKSLFVKRNRRMKKIKAGEGSSDQTQQKINEDRPQDNNSSNFLQQLSRSNIEEESQQQSLSLSYQSEVYQIYNGQFQLNSSLVHFPKNNQITEGIVNHLIVQLPVSQLKIQSYLPQISKNTLQSIENQPKSIKQSIISVVPIEQKLSIRNKDRKPGVLSSYLDLIIDKQISYAGLSFKFDNPAVAQYNNVELRKSEVESISRQREQRASRRQKIRQKAQQLLKRVSKDEDIQQEKLKL